MKTDTVSGIEHRAKLFDGADEERIPADKRMFVAKETFARLLDNYHYYETDRGANGTMYYDSPRDGKRGELIAVRIYRYNQNITEHFINKDYLLPKESTEKENERT